MNHYASKITDNAELILKNRYYLKDENGNPIEDWDGLCKRVASTLAKSDNSLKFRNYYSLMNNLDFLPNSPTLSNAGKNMGLSACYVLPIENSYSSIFRTAKDTALVHKTGGGTGFNFSHIDLDAYYDSNISDYASHFCFSLNPTHSDYNLFYEFKKNTKTNTKTISEFKEQFSIIKYIIIYDTIPDLFDFSPLLTSLSGDIGFIVDFSKVRPSGSKVKSTSGIASGPVSFMKVWEAAIHLLGNKITPITTIKFFDACTEAIKQGGVRRGANMGIVNWDSKYIMDFIRCKENQNEINNFNLSVGITNRIELMDEMYDEQSYLYFRNYSEEKIQKGNINNVTIKHEIEPTDANACIQLKLLMNTIFAHAWANGEPGVVFLDALNENCQTEEVIESTNPCGEQPLLPYESCNLGSLNLVNFVQEYNKSYLLSVLDGDKYINKSIITYNGYEYIKEIDNKIYVIDFDRLSAAINIAVEMLDDVIDANVYPIPEIDAKTKKYRKIGLGVMGLADLFYIFRLPYNSYEAQDLSKLLAKFIKEEGTAASEKLYGRKMYAFIASDIQDYEKLPRKNTTITTIAPTGTISIIAGVSSGIEPVFNYGYIRDSYIGKSGLDKVSYTVIDPIVKDYLINYFHMDDKQITEWVESGCNMDILYDTLYTITRTRNGNICSSFCRQAVDAKIAEFKRIFQVTNDISYYSHIDHQAIWQTYTDNAVSKTINMPNSATIEDVEKAYLFAIEHNCKGITVYRDGSRDSQVLKTFKKEDENKVTEKKDDETDNTSPTKSIISTLTELAVKDIDKKIMDNISNDKDDNENDNLAKVAKDMKHDLYDAVKNCEYRLEPDSEETDDTIRRNLDLVERPQGISDEDYEALYKTINEVVKCCEQYRFAFPISAIKSAIEREKETDDIAQCELNTLEQLHDTPDEHLKTYQEMSNEGYKTLCKNRDTREELSQRIHEGLAQLDFVKHDENGYVIPNSRPKELEGITVKETIGCGNLYITINHDNGKIIEIFTNNGKSGGCSSQSEATARLASIALRAGVSPKEIAKQLRGIRCGSCIRKPGCNVLSCPDAIGRTLENFLQNQSDKSTETKPSVTKNKVPEDTATDIIEITTVKKPESTDKVNDILCPECGSKLFFEGGCNICKNCGYSKCH